MAFSQWLRSNSEYYLLWAAQDRIAKQRGIKMSSRPSGLKDRFWRHVFAPVYFALPDGVRALAFHSLPGSHRRPWPQTAPRPRPPRPSLPSHLLP